MANHRFHGPWRSFVITDDGLHKTLHDDGTLYLNIPNPQGILETGSNHDGKGITGKVDDLNSGKFAVHLQEPKTGSIFVRHYEGVLVDDKHVMISAGEAVTAFFVNADFTEQKNPTAERIKRLLDDGQVDGTWVMTKP